MNNSFNNLLRLLEDRKSTLNALINKILFPKKECWKVEEAVLSTVLSRIKMNIDAVERVKVVLIGVPVKIPLLLEEIEKFHRSCELQRSSLQKFMTSLSRRRSFELQKRRVDVLELKDVLLINRRRIRRAVRYGVSRALTDEPIIPASVKLIVKSNVEESKYDHMEHYSSNVDCLGRLLGWDLDQIEGDGDDPWEFWKFWK